MSVQYASLQAAFGIKQGTRTVHVTCTGTVHDMACWEKHQVDSVPSEFPT